MRMCGTYGRLLQSGRSHAFTWLCMGLIPERLVAKPMTFTSSFTIFYHECTTSLCWNPALFIWFQAEQTQHDQTRVTFLLSLKSEMKTPSVPSTELHLVYYDLTYRWPSTVHMEAAQYSGLTFWSWGMEEKSCAKEKKIKWAQACGTWNFFFPIPKQPHRNIVQGTSPCTYTSTTH